jgi:endonuclease G, mitochondrial
VVTDTFLAGLEATTERYESRSEQRTQTMRTLRERGVLHADTPERVAKRLRRLDCSWALARRLEDTAAVASSGSSLDQALAPESFDGNLLGLERLMGRNDLIDVGFLERGYLASRSVGRITLRSASGALEGYGTGFLVSPRLLLTNNHVLRSAEVAGRAYVELNYQSGLDGMPLQPSAFSLDPQRLFVTNPELDFSLVAVQERGNDEESLSAFGHLRLIEQEGKAILGELLNIIQHPNGEPKQLALRENELVDLLELFLHYQTDTEPGSSGSPVFNDQWEVVGLHHSGVPKRDETGALLAIDGNRWRPEMGEHRLAWIANEGVRISRVLRAIREQELTGAAADLRDQLFEATSVASSAGLPAAGGEAPSAGSGFAQSAAVDSAGEVAQFTLPLRITVGVELGTDRPPASAPTVGPPSAAPAAPGRDGILPADVDQTMLRSGLASLEANRDRPYYERDADASAQERYYEGLDPEADPEQLRRALGELLERTHSPRPRYRPSDLVYPWVDLHPDRLLRSIYSGKAFEPEELIREDARVEAVRTARLQEIAARETALGPAELAAEVAALEAALPFNCEHVVPQSSFGEDEPMRGDLHHLFCCESGCNSFRGNTPYFDFEDFEEVVRHECGRREDDRFEPASGKGAVARATLYFVLRYPGVIGNVEHELQPARLPILLGWHRAEPVGEWERHRNAAIAELQGNRNPLIDHPEWVEQIPFANAFG